MVGRKLQGEEKAAVLAEFAKRGMTGDPPPPPCAHYRGLRQDRDGVVVTLKCTCGGEDKSVHMPVGVCDVHKRCLPSWRPSPDQRKAWLEREEAVAYRLCDGCGEYEPIPGP